MTKDERFLIEIYKALQAAGNLEGSVNPQKIAKKLGFREVLLREIIKGLAKANFIKSYGPEEITLTEGGRALARSLLGK